MIIRRAGIGDIGAIMEFSRAAAESSPTYAPLGFNSVIWRRTVLSSMKDPTMCVIVAMRGSKCCGIIVGMLMPMAWTGGFCASDLVFAADAGGDLLLKEFIRWAQDKKARRIDMGISDTGREDSKDALMRRAGFSRAGGSYYRINEVSK